MNTELIHTARQLLHDAASYIAQHGLHKYEYAPVIGDGPYAPIYESGTPPMCGFGALQWAAYRDKWQTSAYSDDIGLAQYLAERVLCRYAQREHGTLFCDYNDQPTTTAEDVVLAIKIAAEDDELFHDTRTLTLDTAP